MANRAGVGNVLFAVVSCTGMGATWWAFQDPEKGRYTADIDFTNWSGTHSVTCKCGPLLAVLHRRALVKRQEICPRRMNKTDNFWLCIRIPSVPQRIGNFLALRSSLAILNYQEGRAV
jgi:hypothetical protein